MGGMAPNPGQQRQQQMMGPPDPYAPAPAQLNPNQQKLGFKDRLKEDFQKNRKSYGDALTQMGLALMSQKSSTMPTSFGSALGQAAQEGFTKFGESVKEERELTREEEMLKRQEILFRQGQKDRASQQRYTEEDRALSKEDRLLNLKRQAAQEGRELTAFEQANILFEQGLEDRSYNIGQRNKEDAAANLFTPEVLKGLSAEQQALVKYAAATKNPAIWQSVAQNVFADADKEREETTSFKDAYTVVSSQPENQGLSEQELRMKAGQLMGEWTANKGVVTQKSDKSLEFAQKAMEEMVTPIRDDAATAGVNLDTLDTMEEALQDVNTGTLGDYINKFASGSQQVTRILGMSGEDPAGIEAFLETNADSGQLADALSKKLTLNATKLLAGQISEKELGFSADTVPGLLRTPGGNKLLFAVMRRDNQNKIARNEFIANLRAENNGGLPSDVAKQLNAFDAKLRDESKIYDKDGNPTAYGQEMLDSGLRTVIEQGRQQAGNRQSLPATEEIDGVMYYLVPGTDNYTTTRPGG